jgi:hypothetical protein
MIDIIQYTDEDYEKHLTGFFAPLVIWMYRN